MIKASAALLEQHRIDAPLMIVRGDGSLINAATALERPVETILSGPAASVVGALFLAGERDAIVADIGGTATDIAVLEDGRPTLDEHGATVGGWRTMVEAIAVHTYRLGGDSEVRIRAPGELRLGPQRAIPLSLLAHQYPGIDATLQAQLADMPARRAVCHCAPPPVERDPAQHGAGTALMENIGGRSGGIGQVTRRSAS